MSVPCSTNEGYDMRTKCWLESLKRSNHSKGLGIDERVRLKWVLKK